MPRKTRSKKAAKEAPEEEGFSKMMKEHMKLMAAEMKESGERIGFRMGREQGFAVGAGFLSGFLWSFIKTVFGLILYLIMVMLLAFVNSGFRIAFIASITMFLLVNVHWFFLAGLAAEYGNRLRKILGTPYRIVRPVFTAVAAYFSIWVLGWLFGLVAIYTSVVLLVNISIFLQAYIVWITAALVVFDALGSVLWLFTSWKYGE